MDSPLTPQQELEQVLAAEAQRRRDSLPPDPDLLVRRAGLLCQLDQWDESEQACSEAEQLLQELGQPQNLELLFTRGRILREKGGFDESMKVTARAEQLCRQRGLPMDPRVHVSYGSIYLKQGRYELSLKDFDEAERLYREQGKPVGMGLHHGRSLILKSQGRYAEALAEIDAGIQASAARGPVYPGFVALRGLVYLELERNEEALADYLEAEQLCRAQGLAVYPVLPMNRGIIYINQGRYDAAMEAFDEAERLYGEQGLPVYPGIPGNRALVFRWTGRYEEAIASYDESERIAIASSLPVWPGLAIGRGDCYGKLGNFDKAMAEYEKAERQISEQGIVMMWDLHFSRAVTLYEAGHCAQAIQEVYETIAVCSRIGIKQPSFVIETLQDWMSPKPEKLVAEQIASQPEAVRAVPDSEKKHDVFICYRRDPGHTHSMLLQAHLEMKGKTVFRDEDGLSSGRFEVALKDAIRYSRHMVILLTQDFFDRCCTDEGDVVRKEIATALHHGTHIIPVKMEGFSWPASAVLPDDISDICGINAMSHSTEFYTAFIDKLLKWME